MKPSLLTHFLAAIAIRGLCELAPPPRKEREHTVLNLGNKEIQIVYVGEGNNRIPNGYGVLLASNGVRFQGYWSNGHPHRGRLHFSDGTSVRCRWRLPDNDPPDYYPDVNLN